MKGRKEGGKRGGRDSGGGCERRIRRERLEERTRDGDEKRGRPERLIGRDRGGKRGR